MEKELQGKLVEILGAIQSAAGAASDFAMSQLPEVAQSYLLYGRAWATLEVFLWICVVVAAGFGLKWAKDNADEYDLAAFMAAMFSGIGGVVGVIFTMLALNSAFLVWFAPKVWLLKEIARLVK